jgi:hypothetical protein
LPIEESNQQNRLQRNKAMKSLLTARELQDRIKNNDKRCTAPPYLLLLQGKEEHVMRDGYGHDTKQVFVSYLCGDITQNESRDELVKELIEHGYDKDEASKSIEEFTIGYSWLTQNVFLTDEGYKDHMKANGHNVKSDHRTMGIHAFRNLEMKSLLALIDRCVLLEDALKESVRLIEFYESNPVDSRKRLDELKKRHEIITEALNGNSDS